MIKKQHPWLDKYPVNNDSTGLIIGTHPPMPYRGCMPFYYGNMNEFWRLLELVYTSDDFFDKNGKPELESIKKWLEKYNLSITDIVKYTNNNFSVDSDMEIAKGIEQLNDNLYNWIKDSNVNTIYFTSFGTGKSAYGLFRRWYKIYFKEILDSGNEIINSKEEYLIINIFDRNIKLVMLYSPSPAARRGIPRSNPYKNWLTNNQNIEKPIDEFRIYWYGKHLPKNK